MTVRDILNKCIGNTNVYIYGDSITFKHNTPCKEIKLEMKSSNDEMYDRKADWYVSNGDMMIKVNI